MTRLGAVASAVLIAAALSACGKSDTNRQGEGAQASSSAQSGTAQSTQAAELSEEEKKAILASLPAPYNAADLANGEAQFGLCKSCHTVVAGGPNMTGPNLHGVVGTKAATQPADYKYSDALKAANITWTPETLDTWITDPKAMVPQTKMTFVGLKDANARRDVIAYLMVESGYRPK
jgi:cytochrome c